jgi:hypothetical protein
MSIEGTYKDGVLELSEQPEGVTEAHVVVTFMAGRRPRRSRVRAAACARAFARMEAGIDLGGVVFDRAGLYDARVRDLDARREMHNKLHRAGIYHDHTSGADHPEHHQG